jgi:hypothetical protein
LTSKIPKYINTSKKKAGKEAKMDGLASFWAKLFKEYWRCFPWDLPLDQDPDPNAAPPPEEAVGAPRPTLSPEESEWKSKVQKEIKGMGSHFFIIYENTSNLLPENQKVVQSTATGSYWDPGQPVLRVSGAFASAGRCRGSQT